MHTYAQVLQQTGLSSPDEITIQALKEASESTNAVKRQRNGVPEKHTYGSAYLRTEDGEVRIFSGYDLKDVLSESGFEFNGRRQAWCMPVQKVGVCMCVCMCVCMGMYRLGVCMCRRWVYVCVFVCVCVWACTGLVYACAEGGCMYACICV
jgi:hypothetical protein